MSRLRKAFKDLTYSSIASRILLELYTGGHLRSSVLVSSIEETLACSRTLVYRTLNELRRKELIYLPTERKRLKYYALTETGREIVEQEVLRKEVEIGDIVRSISEPEIMALELLADGIFKSLPTNLRNPSNKMLIRMELKRKVENVKKEVIEKLEK